VTGGSSGSDVGQSAPGPGQASSLDVFISYRREDAAASAGRLADALVARFGRNSVFMDVDTIEPGADYTEVIDRAVGHCDVLIALIGPHWLDAANARGRRLDDPQDFVRLEIEAALARNIRVVPTLVGGAAMPSSDQLPGALARLATRNAVELTDKRFRSDIQFLLEPLEKLAQQKSGLAPPAAQRPAAESEALAGAAISGPQPSAKLPSPAAVSAVGAPYERGRQAKPATVRRSRMPLIAGLVAVVLLIGGGGAYAMSRLNAGKAPNQSAATGFAWPGDYAGTWKGTGHQFSPPADFAITLIITGGKVGKTVGNINRPTLSCTSDLTLDKATTQAITLSEVGGGGVCQASGQALGGTKIVVSRRGTSLDWKEFGGDPSANSAVATATLAQGASGTVPGTSDLLSVPDGFLGTWKGTGHEASPSADFAITLIIRAGQVGQTVASMNRPTMNCQADMILDKATAQAITLTELGGGGVCVAGGQGVGGTKIVATLNGTSLDWKEYQGDPAASSAIANATLATGTSGSIPGTSDLLSVPDGYVGTWKGTGHEASPSADFAITLIIRAGQVGETVANMNRPTLNCQADLILDKSTTQAITLTELGGGGVCVAEGQSVGGTKIVVSLSGTSLDWKEYPGDPSSTSATATATLTTG
jgi:hypothetical protein